MIIYLLLLVDLVPLTLLEGDFLGTDAGRGNIGLAGGDTLATSSFSLLDCKLFRGTLGITYELDTALEVDGLTSGVSVEFASFGVMSLLDGERVFNRVAVRRPVIVFESLFLFRC